MTGRRLAGSLDPLICCEDCIFVCDPFCSCNDGSCGKDKEHCEHCFGGKDYDDVRHIVMFVRKISVLTADILTAVLEIGIGMILAGNMKKRLNQY